jgi:hypothetical protein
MSTSTDIHCPAAEEMIGWGVRAGFDPINWPATNAAPTSNSTSAAPPAVIVRFLIPFPLSPCLYGGDLREPASLAFDQRCGLFQKTPIPLQFMRK